MWLARTSESLCDQSKLSPESPDWHRSRAERSGRSVTAELLAVIQHECNGATLTLRRVDPRALKPPITRAPDSARWATGRGRQRAAAFHRLATPLSSAVLSSAASQMLSRRSTMTPFASVTNRTGSNGR